MTTTFIDFDRQPPRPFWTHDSPTCHFAGNFISVNEEAHVSRVHDVYITPDEQILIRDGDAPAANATLPRDVVQRLVDLHVGERASYMQEWCKALELINAFHSNVRPARDTPLEHEGACWSPAAAEIFRHGSVTTGELQTNRRDWYFIRFSEGITAREARHWIKCTFYDTRCRHAYDCCGHRYFGAAKITQLPNGSFLVRQDSYVNV